MLSLVNQVTLIGRAGHRPELSYDSDGRPRTYLKLYQHGQGSSIARQVHHLIAWSAVAEQLYCRVRRGDRLLVQGKLIYRTRVRALNDYGRTEIHLSEFHLLAGISDKPGREEVLDPRNTSGPNE
jgi:single-stranded DNA-binding protein